VKTKIAHSNDSNGGKIAASLKIKDGARMTASGRRRIAAWMRRQATFLEKHADKMAKTYTASWRYD
jgi:hypothetical protein